MLSKIRKKNWGAKVKPFLTKTVSYSQAESIRKIILILYEARYKQGTAPPAHFHSMWLQFIKWNGIALPYSYEHCAHTFSLTLTYKWCIKKGFSFALQFFLLISDILGGVI